MIAWLWKIIVGNCFGHEWEKIAIAHYTGPFGSEGSSYHLRCKKCGEIKFVRSV